MNMSKGSLEVGSKQRAFKHVQADQLHYKRASHFSKQRAKGKTNRPGDGRGASGTLRNAKQSAGRLVKPFGKTNIN